MDITNKIDMLTEGASPYLIMKSRIEQQLKNKPKETQLSILGITWVEMAKNKKSLWWKMNDTEKKSLTKWYNKVTAAVEAGKNPIGY